MNRIIFAISLLLSIFWSDNIKASEQPADSVYLFAYATTKNNNHNGLHFAWSDDGKRWNTIGPEYAFIKSDYGAWGSEKKMFSPFLFRDKQGLWHLIWSLNQYDDVFAHAAVDDLIHWRRQSYPTAAEGLNCLMPEVFYNNETDQYNITWLSVVDNDTICYNSTTSDFKNYTPAIQIATEKRKNLRQTFIISGKRELGTLHRVKRTVVEKLIAEHQKTVQRNKLWSETTKDDSVRFASLKPLEIAITADAGKPKQISDKLIGVFFEDINYAADGGIYAELIENRDFEYSPSDKKGRDTTWNSFKAWSVTGNMTHRIDTVNPLHPNNPHYVVLTVNHKDGSIVNEGFNGIAVKAGEKYNFSLFANVTKGKKASIIIRLTDSHNQTIAETTINKITSDWHQYNAILSAKATDSHARLEIIPQTPGELALDMISLFPQKTFKGRKNGLRADLAQTIADIKPQFVRFPGGCVAHGDGLENIYHWKNTIGPLEARKPQRNIWNYHQSAGLGYFEYFQFCEDINAEPVPIVAAGVPCQNSSCGGAGQQGGIPMCEMDNYVQDVLDLIEWANGSADTYWGHKRAEAGHPEPFNLKYIGVGNEDLITDIFEERFTMIYNALKDKHPEITVIGTVGPWFEGTDYREGWALADKLNIPMVDEHYYQSPGWFIYNQNFYDSYDRSKTKVYLGEYAAHLPGRPNNLETALSEAIYLTSLERNGDIVAMASYAPLLAKEGFTQWNPDLIYFNNSEVKPTVGYFVQKLFGNNSGNTYINSLIDLKEEYSEAVKNRIAASFVRDNKTNDLIIKLVNILPEQIKTNLNLQNLPISSSTATRTLLTGKPENKNARPISDMITISNNFEVELPPYSFTVIRLNLK